MRVEGN